MRFMKSVSLAGILREIEVLFYRHRPPRPNTALPSAKRTAPGPALRWCLGLRVKGLGEYPLLWMNMGGVLNMMGYFLRAQVRFNSLGVDIGVPC